MNATHLLSHTRHRIVPIIVFAIVCSATVGMTPTLTYGHDFFPVGVLFEGLSITRRGDMTTFTIADRGTCAADITVHSLDPTVATVSPTELVTAIEQDYVVTAQTSTVGETFIMVEWEGVGVDCPEKEFVKIPVKTGGGSMSGVCAGRFSNGDLEFNIQRNGEVLSGTFSSPALNLNATVVGGADLDDMCWIALFINNHPDLCSLAFAGSLEEITEDDATFGRFNFGGGKDCRGVLPPLMLDVPKIDGGNGDDDL